MIFLKDFKEAFTFYQAGLRLLTGDISLSETELINQLRSNSCLASLKLGDFDQCIVEATKVLENDANNSKLLHRRAVAYINQADYDKAQTDLEEAIKLDPQNVELKKELDGLGAKQKKMKDKQAAVYKKMVFGDN